MTHFDAVNEEVLDAVAEVANMIIGNVKSFFEEKLGPLNLSVPTVIFGRNYRARSAGVPAWTSVPFDCQGEKLEVNFFLMPSPSRTHHAGSAAPRADALQPA